MRSVVFALLALYAAACSSAAADTGAPNGDAGASNDGGASIDGGASVDASDGGASNDGGSNADAPPTACQGARDASAIDPVLFYQLANAPFPGTAHPDVAVHVPKGFDGTRKPGLVVFFHGFDNCVANVMGSVDTPCTPGGAARDALHLVDQLDAAHVNAILVAVETDFDQSSGNPGSLTTAGAFHALLHELFTAHLNGVLGCSLDVADFDRIVVSSHSGGYEAAAATIADGMVPNIREIDLLDSLYGNIATFDGWVQGNITRFDATRADELRWIDVYTSAGGTDANSRTMAMNAATWLSAAGLSASLLDDDTTDTLMPADYAHPVIFKLSGLAHGDVPKYYFGELLQASGFAPL
jgi:hypothetical protein